MSVFVVLVPSQKAAILLWTLCISGVNAVSAVRMWNTLSGKQKQRHFSQVFCLREELRCMLEKALKGLSEPLGSVQLEAERW